LWISSQNSRRALGSTPAVGSSRQQQLRIGQRAGAERQALLSSADSERAICSFAA